MSKQLHGLLSGGGGGDAGGPVEGEEYRDAARPARLYEPLGHQPQGAGLWAGVRIWL